MNNYKIIVCICILILEINVVYIMGGSVLCLEVVFGLYLI